ncbi:tRNA(5-methylaminomethyl-2-thiouridylate)-methyl transferase [Xylanimonas cellulosilytica DSM 15894]|uniref:tRNA-specific 2-thiouridylase MnmA n=1 Tax=Xylanimonas cellulosilytica (strain DSM 15894 / JCM 12276 / CECT 5975 / KCTC 9989 / LMG 20990 / NBRC 107835 / XIL07) TaxID=446471 RepID=D1BVV4_XYLCX|nr:tRNA 2-thiouridine(34) synthase MnmA [Xylanimonas cellulosilytica]ACZ31423.1 tRNA(5-methylaminomethyl-2-thiouridylate)-methyl transferase [Xylanimonas cellulosilytica DSM 15894]
MRVLAAMSGGVDSAVAAALAVEAGHDVVGVHMALSRNRDQFRTGSRGCCSIEDASDARRAADVLGIPYYVWDLSERFEDTVVADFLAEYEAGRTPNPCVRCNEHIKFETLLEKATALGFDAVATGHYARVVERPDGTRELHRSPNTEKDQSYVLAVMGPERLARAIFPLGGFASKAEVRAEAARRGLAVSAKPDSYDICFVADGDTRGFLRDRLGSRPGEVVDTSGAVVGEHDGAYAYTVGQRKGLALGRPAADGKPRYVLDVRTSTNQVVVGPAELLTVDRIAGDRAVWFTDPAPGPRASRDVGLPTPDTDVPGRPSSPVDDVEIQVRAHGTPVPARILDAADGGVEVELTGTPLRGVAAGQSLVVYRGTQVLGQATVTRAWRAASRHRTHDASTARPA